MAIRLSKPAAALALGVAFLLTPALLLSTSLISVDSAFAAKGGNGNGNSGGNGNGNGNAGSNGNSSPSASYTTPELDRLAPRERELATWEGRPAGMTWVWMTARSQEVVV